MRYGIFTVRDAAMNAFMLPFVVQHRGVAIRSFRDEANKSDSPINKHPQDYSLWETGEFEDSDGILYPITPQLVVQAKDLIGE